MLPIDNALTVGIQPQPTGQTAEYVPRSDLRVSLLLQRDLLSLGFLILCFVVVFALLALTRSAPHDRRQPK